MKKILSFLGAIGLAFAAPSAHAEPSRAVDSFYFVGHDNTQLMLAANNVETNGDQRSLWLLSYFKQTIENVDGVWFLAEFNCGNRSFRFARAEHLTVDGRSVPLPGAGQFETINSGTPAEAMYRLVCLNQPAMELISAPDAVALLMIYRG